MGIKMIDALGGNTSTVAPQRIITVTTILNNTCIPESTHLHTPVTAKPTCDDGALTTSTDVARIITVSHAGCGAAVHNYTEDGTAVIPCSINIAFMTHVFECHPSTAVTASNDTTYHTCTANLIIRTGHQILNDTTTVDHAKDTYLTFTLNLQVVNFVILTVESSHVAVIIVTYRCPCLSCHVDVFCEYGISSILSSIDNGGKLYELVGRTNLVDTLYPF